MRFLPIVLGWVIATSALSAIASVSAPEVELSYAPDIASG